MTYRYRTHVVSVPLWNTARHPVMRQIWSWQCNWQPPQFLALTDDTELADRTVSSTAFPVRTYRLPGAYTSCRARRLVVGVAEKCRAATIGARRGDKSVHLPIWGFGRPYEVIHRLHSMMKLGRETCPIRSRITASL